MTFPGNKLECVEGEATDPGLAPSAGLGRMELKVNHTFFSLARSGFRNRCQVGSLEMTLASLPFGG